MDKVFRENKELGTALVPKGPAAPGLRPITHKEFNEFIKGKGFTGRNNYKLKDLKVMFGFKPMITGSPVMISDNQRDLIPCQRLQPLLEYHIPPSYMLKRILSPEFTLMEKR